MNNLQHSRDKGTAKEAWRSWQQSRATPKQASARPVKCQTAGDTTEILLYDEIGPWGLTAKDFAAALATITTPNICVRINSPGGDVFDGLAIYNALKSSGKRITCQVDGIAASIASVIAMAGSTVRIHESAMIMIHCAWALAIGNKRDMADMATILEKIDSQLAGIYAKQTGGKASEMLALMTGDADGTWFTAAEAVDIGLADEIIADDGGAHASGLLDYFRAKPAERITMKDCERALRAAGAPRGLAKSIMDRGWRGSADGHQPASLAEALRGHTATLAKFRNERT